MKDFWKKNKRIIILLLILSLPLAYLYATTFTFTWPAETKLYETSGFGGSDTTASTTHYTYTGDIDLETNGYYGVYITVQASSTSTTDDLVISYFASFDGTNFDTPGNEFWTVQIDAPPIDAASQTTFQMFPAPPHGRIGLRSSGATSAFESEITYIPMRGDGT
jgi:hypothetical protein